MCKPRVTKKHEITEVKHTQGYDSGSSQRLRECLVE